MEKYYMYLRKSRKDMEAEACGKGETLTRHQKILMELAESMGVCIARIYREVVSGENISSRPEVQRMLRDIEDGECSGVFVMEVERLARGDTKDQGIIADAFKYSSTKIITPIKTYDPNDEYDEEYFEFGLFMSRREYKTINRRIQRGRIASVKEGKFISSVSPYGYNKVRIKNGKGYTLEIDPERADVVRMVYEWYTKGIADENGVYHTLGATAICKKLDEMHIKPMINDNWSRASINDMLKNPVYIGKIRWSYRKEIKKMIDGSVVKMRPDNHDSYILVDGLHPAIISEEMFQAAHDASTVNRKKPIKLNTKLQNPLTGISYCALCGQKMTRLGPNKKTPYSALKCSNHYCKNVSSPLYLVEKKVIQFLGEWLESYDLNIGNCEDLFTVDLEISLKESALRSEEKALSALKKQLDNAYTLVEKGIYTPEIFMERSKVLNEQISEKEFSVDKLNADYNDALLAKQSREEFVPKIRKVVDTYWEVDDMQLRNQMLREIIEKIDYRKEKPNTRGDRENANFTLNVFPKIPVKLPIS